MKHTDWDKECELLKEWLKFSIEVHAENLVKQYDTMRTYKETGVLYFMSESPMYHTISCGFELWKRFR